MRNPRASGRGNGHTSGRAPGSKAPAQPIDSARKDTTLNRRHVLRAFGIAGLAAPLLAACGQSGFKPLYGSTALGGSGVSEKFARVQVAPIPGRVGQQIRNELIFQSSGGGTLPEPAYRLEVAIRERVASTLVKISGETTSSIYNLDASYALIDLNSKQTIFKGRSYGRAGFERVESVFANVRARRNAENRAASTIARELKTRLEAYLATNA